MGESTRGAATHMPPASRVDPVTETLHGVELTDPYRWLEDGDSADVMAWTQAQNAYTRSLLDARPERPVLSRRLAELMAAAVVRAPVRKGDRYFYTARSGDQDQPVLYVRENGRDRPLVDPAARREDATVALDWWYPSPDGSLLAYGLSEGGDEMSTLYVLEVASGRHLATAIDRTRFCSVAWLPDGSGFYYTRYPAPGSVPSDEERYHRSVFLHRLGQDPAHDALVYADADPQAMPMVTLSRDGRYLIVESAHGWSEITLLWCDLQAQDTAFRELSEGVQALFACEEAEGVLYIHTNWDAPNFRVLAAPLDNPTRDAWREIIPEGPHALQNLKIAGSYLVGQTLEQAVAHLRLFSLDGAPRGEIALPAAGTVDGPAASHDADEVLFSFTSFAYPLRAYRYLPAQGRLEVFDAAVTQPQELDIDPARAVVRQVWYPSRDGTPISMFVIHRAGLQPDGQTPTVLTGYGGFNVSRTPEFSAGLLAWVEQGGIYALANLRGGGEYGETWHEAGRLGRKQNVFDDFAAAGEWLIANGYTSARKLACWGGSNGGLLVGAAITQRPALWGAALCAVPLLDMLRYHLFQIARLWIPEYGSSEDAEQFRWLYAYSPYHHVRAGVDYPATLLTTAEGDSRVDPLHARKMTALLQAETSGTRPILLRVESRAGHGQGKPVRKLVDEQADEWTFLAWQLGLRVVVA